MLQLNKPKSEVKNVETVESSSKLGGNSKPGANGDSSLLAAPTNPPITMGQIVYLIADAQKLASMVNFHQALCVRFILGGGGVC